MVNVSDIIETSWKWKIAFSKGNSHTNNNIITKNFRKLNQYEENLKYTHIYILCIYTNIVIVTNNTTMKSVKICTFNTMAKKKKIYNHILKKIDKKVDFWSRTHCI